MINVKCGYRPETFVWEVTMGCNLRCSHCGLACGGPLAGELTTSEALKLCDDAAGLGVSWMTLSGGEPLLRDDWPLIAGRLTGNGVAVCIVTNGTLLNEKAAALMRENRVHVHTGSAICGGQYPGASPGGYLGG